MNWLFDFLKKIQFVNVESWLYRLWDVVLENGPRRTRSTRKACQGKCITFNLHLIGHLILSTRYHPRLSLVQWFFIALNEKLHNNSFVWMIRRHLYSHKGWLCVVMLSGSFEMAPINQWVLGNCLRYITMLINYWENGWLSTRVQW